MKLALAGATELCDFTIEVASFSDFFITRFGCLFLGVFAEFGLFEIGVDFVNLFHRLLESFEAVIEFFFRGGAGFVELSLGILGAVVLGENGIHIENADLHLGVGRWREREHGGGENGCGE